MSAVRWRRWGRMFWTRLEVRESKREQTRTDEICPFLNHGCEPVSRCEIRRLARSQCVCCVGARLRWRSPHECAGLPPLTRIELAQNFGGYDRWKRSNAEHSSKFLIPSKEPQGHWAPVAEETRVSSFSVWRVQTGFTRTLSPFD